jgi:hypothetical protein
VLTITTGTVIWLGSFLAHDRAEATATEAHTHPPGTAEHHDAVAGHVHGFAARAQAGVIMRKGNPEPPTPEQVAAAAAFAAATKAGIAKYADLRAAIADGYVPDGPALGVQRHFTNKAHKKDGRIMDSSRPEQLVYAFAGNRHLLLGAVYIMEKAGAPGPEIGGSLTRWHSHNICVTVLPPAFGLVSPFGTCPVLSVATTLPDMIHVWTVDYPEGPYADRLDDAFVKDLLTQPSQ